MNRRYLAIALPLVPLAVWLGARQWAGSSPKKETPAEVADSHKPKPTTHEPQKNAAKKAPLDTKERNPLQTSARSLRGTDIDGALRVGPDGSLLVGPDLLRLFDYYFTTEGEESEEIIKQKILALIRERLEGPAAREASALLDQYLRYRKDAQGIRLGKDEEADPTKRLEALKTLRRDVFGEKNAAQLFGDEELEGEIAIAEKKLREDVSLTEEERNAKIAELEAKLPESVKAAREASTLPLRAGKEALAMRARGASEEEIAAYRTETLGEDAANRLAALDKERAAWKARLDEFTAKRAKLKEQLSDEEAFQKAEQALLDESFTPLEQRRVRATLAMKEQ